MRWYVGYNYWISSRSCGALVNPSVAESGAGIIDVAGMRRAGGSVSSSGFDNILPEGMRKFYRDIFAHERLLGEGVQDVFCVAFGEKLDKGAVFQYFDLYDFPIRRQIAPQLSFAYKIRKSFEVKSGHERV